VSRRCFLTVLLLFAVLLLTLFAEHITCVLSLFSCSFCHRHACKHSVSLHVPWSGDISAIVTPSPMPPMSLLLLLIPPMEAVS
jgi:hypothetical protein